MKKAKKYIDYFNTKVTQLFTEKKYTNNGVTLKYLYKPNKKSNILIVVFSACTRAGVKARYNYVRTLKNIGENCLFILDDFAEDNRGAYYLGYNCGNEIETATRNLISNIQDSCHAKKIIMCGSSKGGWAALNFMTCFPGSTAIVGAPQYKLANYLLAPPLESCRKYVLTNPTEENILYLNTYLKRKLDMAKKNNNEVFLHYSNKEHTYDDHVKFLLDDLQKYEYSFTCECLDYTNHWDVSLYFPGYLLKCLNKCINDID